MSLNVRRRGCSLGVSPVSTSRKSGGPTSFLPLTLRLNAVPGGVAVPVPVEYSRVCGEHAIEHFVGRAYLRRPNVITMPKCCVVRQTLGILPPTDTLCALQLAI